MGTNIRTKISEANPYYLDKHEYLMVRHFALLYPEWRKQKADILNRVNYGFKIGGGKNESVVCPVEKAAEEAEKYSVRMNLVEQSAKIAGGDIWKYLLVGVTTECNFDYLRLVKGIPCCKDVYYKMYRQFFWILFHEICNLLNGNQIFLIGGNENGRTGSCHDY